MNIGTETVLNMIPGGVMPIVSVNQYDTGYQKKFRLFNGAIPFNIATNQSVTIRGTKGDGHGIVNSVQSTVGSNVVTVTITEQMTAVKGVKNIYELRVVDNNGLVIGTANFIMAVERAALDDDTIISDSDLSYANDVANRLQSVEAFKNQLDAVTEHSAWYVRPEEYGAAGDGVTDDYTALQTCINFAKGNGRIVLLSGKRYKCGSALNVGAVTIIGSGRDATGTILNFYGTSGIIINDRNTIIENVLIAQGTDGTGVGIEFDDGNHGTIPDVYLSNLSITHFEYGLRASKATSWSNKFDNIRLQYNKNALYFDSFATGLSASQFCNEFNNLLITNVTEHYSLYLRGAMCIFNNANISCTHSFCVSISSSYVQFNSCSFENDAPIADNVPMMSIGQYVDFVNCRFVHNYTTEGNNYFIYSQGNGNLELHIRFINCHDRGYTGSKLTSVVSPNIGLATNYGSVYESGNTFSIYDTVYNTYKSYIQRAGQPITLFSSNYDITKLNPRTLYDYYDETNQKWYLVYLNGNQLYDYKTNNAVGTLSVKTTFTPASGTDGGCYYELINGYMVHVHLAVTNLTANTVQVLYTLPSDVRPSESMPFIYFNTAGTPSQYARSGNGVISNGGIVKYAESGVFADIYYCLT